MSLAILEVLDGLASRLGSRVIWVVGGRDTTCTATIKAVVCLRQDDLMENKPSLRLVANHF